MPRVYVNSMANFIIQGGMVSFSLQDQAMSTAGGQPEPQAPEAVAHVVMREQDFAQLVTVLNQHVAAFESQVGRPLGAQPQAGGEGQRKPGQGPAAAGMKIRPKKG